MIFISNKHFYKKTNNENYSNRKTDKKIIGYINRGKDIGRVKSVIFKKSDLQKLKPNFKLLIPQNTPHRGVFYLILISLIRRSSLFFLSMKN